MRDDDNLVVLEDLWLVSETEKAYLIRTTVSDGDIWIPKSQVREIQFGKSITDDDEELKEIIQLELPEWLAIDKGLA